MRRNLDRRAHAANLVAHEASDGFSDGLGFVSEFGAEESTDGDFESESHHFFGHVAAIALFPIFDMEEGLIGHGLGVFGDALAVKCRLGQAALPEPEFAFGGEQALSEKALGGVTEARTFFKFLRLADEDLFDQIGIAEQGASLEEQREINDVTVAASHASEEAGRVVEKFGGAADDGPAAGTGGFGVWVWMRGGAGRFGGEGFGAVGAHEFSLPVNEEVFASGRHRPMGAPGYYKRWLIARNLEPTI